MRNNSERIVGVTYQEPKYFIMAGLRSNCVAVNKSRARVNVCADLLYTP